MKTSPAPPGEYSGQKLLIFTAIYVPAQIVCVALRYLARYLVKGPWGLDDILVMASLCLQTAMGIISVCTQVILCIPNIQSLSV